MIFVLFILKIKSKIKSNEEIKNKYETIKGKLIGSKTIETSFSRLKIVLKKALNLLYLMNRYLSKVASTKSIWTLLGTYFR